ncbi:MAG: glycosyltransferase [Planctomycetales bacterium]|nr:glycosyltransferase [Planctomycetales bacterium]
MTSPVVFWLGWFLFAVWCVFTLPIVPFLATQWLRRRTDPLLARGRDAWPSVTVIVAARDEAAKIEESLRSLLASDYPRMQLIAVDDRSNDATGSIMDRVAVDDERLRIVHVRELPAGWLGKCHAMHLAAQQANGDFMLFTDGDILHAPDTLRRTVAYMEEHRVDHLCLFADFIPGGYWENALNAFFAFVFFAATKPWLVSTRMKFAYVGVGAFNLVRTTAYQAIGGHVPIRLDILDDVKLGKLVKDHGYQQAVLMSGDLLRVKWQASLMGSIRGLEKNAFAGAEYSLTRLALATGGVTFLVFAPYVFAILAPGNSRWGFVAALLTLHATYGLIGWCWNVGFRITLGLPVATLLLLWSFWRSAVIVLRQGGVRWRDTFYPLDSLRENLYR